MPKNALILSGGGARAAYQVGVLRGVADILPNLHNPFSIICGTSAGAINATALAAHPGEFRQAVLDLAETWKILEINQVYKTGWGALLSGGAKTAMSVIKEGFSDDHPIGLLDNSPLREFLTSVIPFKNIPIRIRKGDIEALCITALGYNSGESVSFFNGNKKIKEWSRYRRIGRSSDITIDHLMASSAIPIVFPAMKIGQEYFGDGALRQMAPISPALHLGADRVFIIGVSGNRHMDEKRKPKIPMKHTPSIAQIIGQLFNAAFIDSLEGDIERLERVNDLLHAADYLQNDQIPHALRPVDTLVISPSKPLDKIAGRNIRKLPKSMRFFMRQAGATAKGGGSAAASYLLFTYDYHNELIELGYQDAMWEKEKIAEFFSKA